jgi:hypothetical protein
VAEIKKYPAWVKRELAHPKPEGGRNEQMIKVGPELLRCGHDVDSLFELFCDTYPDMAEREILGVAKSAAKYVGKEDKRIAKGDYMKWRHHLRDITRKTGTQFDKIMDEYRWLPDEFTLECSTWPLIDQRAIFLDRMFQQSDVLWIGMVWETGEREDRRGRMVNYRNHFKTVWEWMAQPNIKGEFTSHCVFKPGTNSRCNEQVERRCYVVVESDVLNVNQVGAVFNYLNASQDLKLRAIVSTGGKSIHGWFEWPSTANESAMAEWGAMLAGLKCDPSVLRPSQPVRLPGCIRRDTKRPQNLLYLT